jgi:hypothetical protein
MEEDKHLQLIDVMGIPLSLRNIRSDNLIFSHRDRSLIYSLGSNIIRYNLKKNSKTFLQYFSSTIAALKYIEDDLNILVVINNNSPYPFLSIWKVPSFQGIFSQELVIKNNIDIDNIYISKLNPSTLIILILNKKESEHYLYALNILNESKFEINFFGKIKNILPKIIGFNSFYRSNDIIFLMKYNIQYFTLDLFKATYSIKKNINFSFKLKENSLKVSPLSNFLCALTEKGNCLIYDKNGINNSNISPIGNEFFTSCEFCDKSLCLGTNIGNVYVYNIYGFILKYMIKNEHISRIKNFSLINKIEHGYNIYYNSLYEDNEIAYASINEINDQLFVLFQNKFFFFLSIKQLLQNTQFKNNIKSEKINSISFYSFNHSNKIFDLILKFYNKNIYKNKIHNIKFYTCSQDNKLIINYIEQGKEKIRNLYYDLTHILSISKATNNETNYITSIKLHPILDHKLYAGDNKGFLYIIYLNPDSLNKYKKYNIDSFSIIYLNFSPKGNLLFIGLETGKQLIYKTNKSLECIFKLTENFLSFDEIEYRKMNNHIISFGYFFSNKAHRHCIIYLKKNNILEYSKLFSNDSDGNNNKISKKKIIDIIFNHSILDIKMHPSENYILIVNDKKQVLFNNIKENKITAVIDLNSQIHKIYNIQIDISGLYLAIVCDIKSKSKNFRKKTDLILVEINTSKVKNYIIETSPINKVIFDNEGKYLIIGGELGEISLWRLPGDISSSIKNLLGNADYDEDFWDNFEIKYSKYNFNNNISNNNYNDEITSTFINNYNNSDYFSSKIDNNNDEENNSVKGIKSYNTYNTFGFKNKDRKNNGYKLSKSMTARMSHKNYYIMNAKEKIKENVLPKIKYNYVNNYEVSSDLNNFNNNLKNQNNIRYNFWSKSDTINIKKSINLNGNNKFPEPKDIDDYLLK